jgi:hypothetical protein
MNRGRKIKVSFAEWMINNLGEDAIEKYWSDKNEISPWDIGKASDKVILINCQLADYHGNYEITPNKFTNQGCRCPYCNTSGKKVHKKDSFAQWGIDNFGEDFVKKYWSKKNSFSPWELSVFSNKEMWLICNEKNYHDEYKTTAVRFTKMKSSCPYCSGRSKIHPLDSFGQWCIDNIDKNFIDNFWSDKNIISPFEIAIHSGKTIWIKCQNIKYHEDYKSTPKTFTKGQRCSNCSKNGGKLHILDSLGSINPKTLLIWSDKNEKSPFEYSPNSQKSVYWKCENEIHEDYNRAINSSNRHSFRCPRCVSERRESILQEKVRLFLTEELCYKVNHEHNCELKCVNPKTNFLLPYDNEIIINKEIKLIIEVQGEQHYKICKFTKLTAKKNNTTPQEELEYQQWKDQFKMDYAISKGYYYLAIPYWTDNKQEEWKNLIMNKLNEINNN